MLINLVESRKSQYLTKYREENVNIYNRKNKYIMKIYILRWIYNYLFGIINTYIYVYKIGQT
jgi:hypothetical protein